jgi:hypothetical protein
VADPTLDELIDAVSHPDAAHGMHFSGANAAALAAALRELRDLRAGVQRVKALHVADALGACVYCVSHAPDTLQLNELDDLWHPCPTLRALTPEGTT